MPQNNDRTQASLSILLGAAVGDALGVPVEFLPRDSFCLTDMLEREDAPYPVGTWSDDTSLTLALADNLKAEVFALDPIADAFVGWLYGARYTPHGVTFGIGHSTQQSIQRIRAGVALDKVGGRTERDNGNGSLMRIAPLAVYLAQVKEIAKRFAIVKAVSSLTHAHDWSVAACFIYIEMLRKLMNGQDKLSAYRDTQNDITAATGLITPETLAKYERVLTGDIRQLSRDEISSTGFVVHTLEAALWCFLTTNDYRSAVLTAVNLGLDADTVAAVTGAMAGLYYGFESIPQDWLTKLVKRNDIEAVARKLKPLSV
ncbi:MAG: ADP-ribosylglycohydrolase family protein [Sutterellaceae bacterium]|nr:ADP-ribosylglycohydrolase family protein [Sutterellaceae bacterium]